MGAQSDSLVEIGLTDMPKSGGCHITTGTPTDDRPAYEWRFCVLIFNLIFMICDNVYVSGGSLSRGYNSVLIT